MGTEQGKKTTIGKGVLVKVSTLVKEQFKKGEVAPDFKERLQELVKGTEYDNPEFINSYDDLANAIDFFRYYAE